MKYIKSVHKHGSEIFLLELKDEKSLKINSIVKTSTSQNGINSIISECKGIDWYNNQSKNKIVYNLENKTSSYHRLKMEINSTFFNINFNKGYHKIKKYLDLTINHYIQIWCEYRGHQYAPFHGDLSLVGNVMFDNKDEVLFVDWEQFDTSMKMPTGLDVTMTLLENICYETIRFKKIKMDVLKHFVNSLQVLNEAKLLSPLLINNPAKNTLDFIKSNTDIWKGQHFKLPVLKLSKNIIEEIDNAMYKMIG